MASQFGDIALVDSLLKKGADVFCKTSNGNLSLALAVNSDKVDIVKRLFKEMY